MADFNINLAKSMVSTPEQRQRFYNRMLIYLVICAAAMVYVAFLASFNMVKVVQSNRERQARIATTSSMAESGKTFYRNPEKTYQQLDDYAKDLETLRGLLSRRVHFLPVLNQLFVDFPEDIALQSLTANATSKTVGFALVAPYRDQKGKSPVSNLQTQWKGSGELLNRTTGVRQVTSERRLVGDTAAVFVKFECVLR